MFGGKFNTTHYNLKQTVVELPIRFYFADRLACVAGFGTNIAVAFKFTDKLYGRAAMFIALPIEVSCTDTLDCAARMNAEQFIKLTLAEKLACTANVILDMRVLLSLDDTLRSVVHIGKDMQMAHAFSEQVNSRATVTKDIVFDMNISEILSCVVAAFILENQEIILNVTIQPHGELRIDSEFYTAMLDNTNVLHLHQGDWITIDKSLIYLDIDNGTGGKLDSWVSYNERYL